MARHREEIALLVNEWEGNGSLDAVRMGKVIGRCLWDLHRWIRRIDVYRRRLDCCVYDEEEMGDVDPGWYSSRVVTLISGVAYEIERFSFCCCQRRRKLFRYKLSSSLDLYLRIFNSLFHLIIFRYHDVKRKILSLSLHARKYCGSFSRGSL